MKKVSGSDYTNFTQDKMSTFEKLMNETVGGCG